jgi:Tol biopolymer transport system component
MHRTMKGRVPNDAGALRAARGKHDNRIAVAASFAMLGAVLGGCDVGETNQPLTLVEQKPTGPTTGTAGSSGGPTVPGGGAVSGDAWIAFDSDGGMGNRDVYVIRADGTGRRRLTTAPSTDAQPSFSSDGSKLAFASDREGGVMQIYLMDLATGLARQVTQRSEGAHDPAFTSDGTRVGYRSGASLFTSMLDGTDERQVADVKFCCVPAPFGGPVFLSDGRTMVYDQYNGVYATVDGGAPRAIAMPTTAEQSHPSASPDGASVALQATCLGDNAARSIWTLATAGTTEFICLDGHRLSAGGTDATHASWGPHDMIVWGSVAGGNNSSSPVPSSLVIWQDGNLRALTSGRGDDRNPSWSPAGAVIGNW